MFPRVVFSKKKREYKTRGAHEDERRAEGRQTRGNSYGEGHALRHTRLLWGWPFPFPLLSLVARCQTMLFGRRVRPAGDGAAGALLSPCAPSVSEESTSTREDCRTEETGGNASNPANGDGGAAWVEP